MGYKCSKRTVLFFLLARAAGSCVDGPTRPASQTIKLDDHSSGPARVTAGTHPTFVSFATEPLHGLFCKRRWRRVCYRHNWVRNTLAASAASLNRMPGIQAVQEPMVMTRRAPGDQQRGDVKVVKSGTSWILDVGIICPAPRQQGH